jgi:isopentenyl diphosphate isomerase/L-lactate dehydrogenase-like FMN-dependent dehydrogenase
LPQQYLPNQLLGTYFYKPTAQGYEAQVAERLTRWREAQRKALEITESKTLPDFSKDEIETIKKRHKPSGVL